MYFQFSFNQKIFTEEEYRYSKYSKVQDHKQMHIDFT